MTEQISKGVEENPTLNSYFSTKEEWEAYLYKFNVRKIINPYEKSFVQKMKRYYKTYGFEMILYADQKKRLDLILKDLENDSAK